MKEIFPDKNSGQYEGSMVAEPAVSKLHLLHGMMEPTTGIEPVNLFLTKEVLYLLSYVGLRENSQY